MRQIPLPIAIRGALLVLSALAAGASAAQESQKYPDGSLEFKVPLNSKGQRDGPYVGYYEGGKKIKERASYSRGQLHGLRQLFTETGSLVTEESWVNGRLVFPRSPRLIEAMRTQEAKEAAAAMLKMGRPHNSHAPSPDALARALGSLRFYRWLCDVPQDVICADDLIDQCQFGAEVLSRNNALSHDPPRPSGMDENAYEIGRIACGHSNLSSGADIVGSVDAYLDDSDPGNIDRLGHRRWLLNPPMGKTGFGSSGRYSCMYAMDHSGKDVPDYQFVCFPPRGVCPAGLVKPTTAWHISFNPAHFDSIDESVEVAIYLVDASLRRSAQPLAINYRHLDTGGFGISNALIFRPRTLAPRGSVYEVVITGVKSRDDKPVEVSYFVSFY